MTQLAQNTAYLQIEDRLDAIGQKYRGQQIVRGAILWLAVMIVSSWSAALLAHVLGARAGWLWCVLILWTGTLLSAGFIWIVRPLFIRPAAVTVARLVEAKVAGLHNGLTNSLLLAGADDLRDSIWLAPIFDEIHAAIDKHPVGDAVRWRDLRPMALRVILICVPLLVICLCFPNAFAHGWEQMLHPASFVPRTGMMRIVSVQPGDVTLVSGQPLEITAIVNGPEMPDAKLIFDNLTVPVALPPTRVDENLRYSYRQDHLDHSLRYRLETGGTQSPWYSATVVQQIKLVQLIARITPPPYTGKPATVLTLKADELPATPIAAPEGSTIELSAVTDVATSGAMLQLAEKPPTPMTANIERTRFDGQTTISQDTPIAFLLMDGAGQIVAKLPEEQLVVHCIKDSAPAIEMKWPKRDSVVSPQSPVNIQASLKDDYGVTSGRVLMSSAADQPLTAVTTFNYPSGTFSVDLNSVLNLNPELRQQGHSIRVQVEAKDNRDLSEEGAQTTKSPVIEIKFADAETTSIQQSESTDKLAAILMKMLKTQEDLHSQTVFFKGGQPQLRKQVNAGQTELRTLMQTTADGFTFDESDRMVQKTLMVLALNPAKDAVDLSTSLAASKDAREQMDLSRQLQVPQRRIISTLQSMLALLRGYSEPTSQPSSHEGGQLVSKPDEFKKLDDALKEFMKEQKRILDQTAGLAKKPVDNFSDKDKKLLNDLLQQQDKLDAFMQAKVSDFSKLAEQDMCNASLLKDMMAIYSEVTMAKDALKQKAVEIAVPAEENGLEGAQELSTNLEKWLANTPDRTKWTQEELPTKSDTPMAELPKELEDMVGDLLEQQEDLFDEVEDMNANITDSMDKGVGWDAMDGPIADMSAKGVSGNVLPNNNEMGGRSGEGRSGQSQGEFVGDNAIGKGGRNTPTRLDPTAFQQGEINDTSKDPVGGATGGGKISGSGSAGLEGPVPPQLSQQMMRLAQKQAEIRNTAERLNLQYQVNRYDNFRLQESIALMRRVESDLDANRYQTALRRRDVLLDDIDTSHLMLSGRIHVEHDTTPTTSLKTEQELNDAMKGELPPAWSEPLKEYYKRLAAE